MLVCGELNLILILLFVSLESVKGFHCPTQIYSHHFFQSKPSSEEPKVGGGAMIKSGDFRPSDSSQTP